MFVAVDPPPPRLRRACDTCHQLKVRCSGTMPCETCLSSNNECFYSQLNRLGRPKGSKNRQILKQRKSTALTPQLTPPGDPYTEEWSPLTTTLSRINCQSDQLLSSPRESHAGAPPMQESIASSHCSRLSTNTTNNTDWDMVGLEGLYSSTPLEVGAGLGHTGTTNSTGRDGGWGSDQTIKDPTPDWISKLFANEVY
jgi:hypothetical protein